MPIIMRSALIFTMLIFCVLPTEGKTANAVVADSVTGIPLPNASVFDRYGKFIGTSNSNGRMPYIDPAGYPVTVRYLGFLEKVVTEADGDTVFLQESPMELSEVVVETRRHKVLHLLAYVREYSTLSTYTDTVFLFREKMVDYMLPSDRKMRFKGWSSPRVLASRSYYRFTDVNGLDSVSDRCNHHFSWTDWMGIVPVARMPESLVGNENGAFTLAGKYSPAEVWVRNGSRITLDVDVLADASARRWVPHLDSFFQKDIEFEQMRVRFNYENVAGDSVAPVDLAGYSFAIESNGRGHGMFMFNRVGEPFFVSTYAEIYMADKEYITLKEARKWERRREDAEGVVIYEPADVPDLQPAIQLLVDRVNTLDNDRIRLALTPDSRLIGRNVVKQNFGQRLMQLFKTMTGISAARARRNWKRGWRETRRGIQDKTNKNKDIEKHFEEQ